MKQIAYGKEAIRALQRLPANTSKLIRSKMIQYARDPGSLANNIKALRGYEGIFRLRIGDWRVLFSEDGTVISIIKIASRRSAYDP